MVLMAGVWLSVGGLIVRHILGADDWQIVFYRSMGAAVALLALLAIRDRGAAVATFRNMGVAGVVAGMGIAVSMVTFILSVNATSVANTLFLMAASPFMAAILGWLLLRERIAGATWLAMATALAGVGIMVWHGVATGAVYGDVMGLLTALGFAVFTVALRFGRLSDMMPAVCLAGLISASVAAAVVTGSQSGFAIPLGDFLLCVTYGAIIAGALTVFTVGARTVPAAELTLLSLTEVLLGPVWVWAVLAETPSPATMLGGAVLFTAIAGQAMFRMTRR